jgi:hypothetical protein
VNVKRIDAFAILDTFYEYGGNFIDTYVVTKSWRMKALESDNIPLLKVPTVTKTSNQKNGSVNGWRLVEIAIRWCKQIFHIFSPCTVFKILI